METMAAPEEHSTDAAAVAHWRNNIKMAVKTHSLSSGLALAIVPQGSDAR